MLKIMQLAKQVVSEMIKDASKAVEQATGEEQLKKAKQVFSETSRAKSERSLKSMIELAKDELPISANDLDKDPFLLNCQNGVVDLRTGQLKPHDQELYMSKIAGASYLPGKPFSKFEQFLKDVTCGDSELTDYFQQICGMAAVGKVFYEGMCMFYGAGRNGKSTFLNCILKVFGDYACAINPEVLMSQKDGKQINGAISVEGKRFVTTEETEEGRRLSGAMLKKLASSGPVVEKRMYKDERTFLPSHTLIMATNHLPKVGSTDVGTWRRIAVVPFKAVFEGKNEIKDYGSVLYDADADAILAWIVEGAKNYIKNGCNIVPPKSVQEATAQYRGAENWLGNFLGECCETGDYEESGKKLFETYKVWCDENNETYVRRINDFAAELERQGFSKKHTMAGNVWMGLRLITSAQASSLYKYRYDKSYKQQSVLDDDDLDDITRRNM
jgi:putative DNA primase/helicase